KQTYEVGTLMSQLATQYNNNQDITATATELASKIAVGALSLAKIPYAESIVKISVNLGNQVVGAAIDSYFKWQDTHNGYDVQAVTDHTTMVLPDTLASMRDTVTTGPVAQSTLYTWAGQDTAGFAGVQFPGAGVQDLTTNKTSVVAAGYSGSTYTYAD